MCRPAPQTTLGSTTKEKNMINFTDTGRVIPDPQALSRHAADRYAQLSALADAPGRSARPPRRLSPLLDRARRLIRRLKPDTGGGVVPVDGGASGVRPATPSTGVLGRCGA
jgi:hypothetical protein